MIRVLVVEDSKTVQRLLVTAFNGDPDLQVVGTAETGEQAVEAARTLRPDLITMDVNLPGMNGYQATRTIMSSFPVPIVVVSGKVDPADSATLFRFMEAGALMVLAKPEPVGTPGHAASMQRLINHIKLMSEIKVVRRTFPRAPQPAGPALPEAEQHGKVKVVAIGASTGGPPLLQQMLSALPAGFPAAVLVVQHMAEGFMENFVHWLNQSSRLPVVLAVEGMPVTPGRVLVAPNGRHMTVSGDLVRLVAAPAEGIRPSATSLFRSVAGCYGSHAVGILLSGMGSDGAQGLKEMRDQGCITIAQSAETSVVFGMPGAAIKLAAAKYVLSPGEIMQLLATLVPS